MRTDIMMPDDLQSIDLHGMAAGRHAGPPPHMQRWNAMARPPQSALKQIKGGRLQGFTDVNPQWRYQAMTEQFGPCGIGWRYTIDRLWTEPGAEGEVLAFAQVSVYTRADDRPGHESQPIVGIGGNHLIVKEAKGLRNNDECWKMAVTDALSVALKMLGVAADVYAGLWDGSKYVDLKVEKAAEKAEAKATVKTDKETKAARKAQPLPDGAVYVEKVIPKQNHDGTREWAEIILSTGETVVAQEPGCITLATCLAQEVAPVLIAMSRNGKGNLVLDEIARWKPDSPQPPTQATGAF